MNKFSNSLTIIGKLLITVAFGAFLVATIKEDYQKARVTTLNYFKPESLGYLQTLAGTPEEKKSRLTEYLLYFQKIARAAPRKADVQDFLGFCYYHLGKEEKAIAAYRKSAQLNPAFFWSHYNLGVVYFKTGHYHQAAASFEAALKTHPEVASKIMSSSRLYKAVLKETNPKNYPDKNLTKIYHRVPTLIVLSYYASDQDSATYSKFKKEADSLQVYIF